MTAAHEMITGGFWQGRNWSADAVGGIHDDATATKLGFRGGTVAGNIHMDQFVPVLRKVFGDAWLERGALSMYFRNATIDGEPVRVSVEAPAGRPQVRAVMHRDDGMEVMSGTASLGEHSQSELRMRDLRPAAAESMSLLRNLGLGNHIREKHFLSSEKQLQRIARNWISDPIPEHASADNRWRGIVATPSSVVDLLWGVPTGIWRAKVGKAVGLFGAAEVALYDGPLLLDREYLVEADVIALTDSPKTEGFWFDACARDEHGKRVATHRMLLRFMKGST